MNPAMRFLTAEAWAMEPAVFNSLKTIVQRHAAGVRLSADEIRSLAHKRAGVSVDVAGVLDDLMTEGDVSNEPAMQIAGSTAIIPVVGVIARYASQINGPCQDQGRSADALQEDLAAAIADPAVKQVVLRIDSPGGTVAGTAEIADAIRRVSAAGKPVIAFIDGWAASAAYWLASQCDEIVAGATTAGAGSIGVICAYVDASKALADEGYQVDVFRSVDLKAPGAMNEKLTTEQKVSIQRKILELHDAFEQAVAAGRGFTAEQIAKVATGEMWAAGPAMKLGLVDSISSFGDLMARLDPAAAAALRTLATRKPMSIAAPPLSATAPNPQPSTAKEESTMKITADQLAAAIEANPALASMIATAAKAGDDLAAITAKVDAAKSAAAAQELKDAKEALATEQAAHTATKKAADEKAAADKKALADLQVKHDKLAGFTAGMPRPLNPADPTGLDPAGKPKVTKTTAELDAMSGQARADFFEQGGAVANPTV